MNAAILARDITSRLWRFKVRTFFMGLGITIGVLATVLLQSVAMTIEKRFTAFIRSAYPANAVVLLSGGGPMDGAENRDRLRQSDIETIVSELSIREWDPMVVTRRDVRQGAAGARIMIQGHSEQAEVVRQLGVREGEFLSRDAVQRRDNVAVLGTTTARELFAGESPLGKEIFIDNIPFLIQGVLAERGLDVHGRDQDQVIVVPYTTLMDKVMRVDYVPAVTLMLHSPDRVPGAKAEIERILRERHQIAPGQEDDFTVMTTETVMQMFNRSLGTMRIFIPLIAATAFLLSGLVILAIMQLSIRSRRLEIGLRKALGARDRDLSLQFFIEVAAIAAVASIAGALLSRAGLVALMPMLTERLGIEQVPVSASIVLIALLAAIVTGVLGALLPARRAARLDPVQALR